MTHIKGKLILTLYSNNMCEKKQTKLVAVRLDSYTIVKCNYKDRCTSIRCTLISSVSKVVFLRDK